MTTTTCPTAADLAMSEAELERGIKRLAKLFGWLYYHTWRSVHSPAGFPDCVLVRPPRVVFAELKRQQGEPSAEQCEWLEQLGQCPGYEAYLWRPSDLAGEILEVLR